MEGLCLDHLIFMSLLNMYFGGVIYPGWGFCFPLDHGIWGSWEEESVASVGGM